MKQVKSMHAWEASRNALQYVLEAEKGDSISIFCDDEKAEIGKAFEKGASDLGLLTNLVILQTCKDIRKEIPEQILEVLRKPPAIFVNVLRGIREEAPFRIHLIHLETEGHRSRLGHCPGITLDMLTEGALALKAEEHKRMQGFAKMLMTSLNHAANIEIRNAAGTNISLNVEGRPFFTDTVVDRNTNKWMNLPTGEVIVGPVEDSLEGKLVCDMAVGGIGPINTPVFLDVRDGRVKGLSCADSGVLKRVKDSLDTDENSNAVGEFAFGINPKARFVDEFLEAEKMLGTTHIAFGNNADFPCGKNPSKNHLDLLMSKPTVKAINKDGSSKIVLADGLFRD